MKMTQHTPYGLLWQAQELLQSLLAAHRQCERGSNQRKRLDRAIAKAQQRQARRYKAERETRNLIPDKFLVVEISDEYHPVAA
jgi:hypothetical protein